MNRVERISAVIDDRYDESRLPTTDADFNTTLVGLTGVAIALALGDFFAIDVVYVVTLVILIPALSMALYDLSFNKVYRRPSTGLDFSQSNPGGANSRVLIKCLGYWATWLIIAVFYWISKEFVRVRYVEFFAIARVALPIAVILTPIYVAFIDRFQIDPHDGAWHFGAWLIKHRNSDRAAIRDHLCIWGTRGFFLPMIVAPLTILLDSSARLSIAQAFGSPHLLLYYYTDKLWIIDCAIDSVGYLFASRLLDTHCRGAFRDPLAWIVTLVCYNPFNRALLTATDNFEPGKYWDSLIAVDSSVGIIWAVLIALAVSTNIFSNVTFGLRFSNLSYRGIVTSGPYRYFKHPAYLSKNIAWWLMYVPFIPLNGPIETARSCLLLIFINLIYYLRCVYEEKELMSIPKYREYARYIDEFGAVACINQFFARLRLGRWTS